MKKLNIVIVVAATAALAACSDDESSKNPDGHVPDASDPDPSDPDATEPDEPVPEESDPDAPVPDASDPEGPGPDADLTGELEPADCDPVAQTGCETGQKCTVVFESTDPVLTRTDCVEDGDIPLSGACASEEHGSESWDNCSAGTLCMGGVCEQICGTTPDTCVGGICTVFSDMFTDRDGVGVCWPACDPLAQDCADPSQACYLDLTSGDATCAPMVLEAVQGEDCMYINGCQIGYGCILANDPVAPTGLTCAFFCDATGSGGPACADGPGVGFTCVSINEFYGDDIADDAIGLCVDPEVWPGF